MFCLSFRTTLVSRTTADGFGRYFELKLGNRHLKPKGVCFVDLAEKIKQSFSAYPTRIDTRQVLKQKHSNYRCDQVLFEYYQLRLDCEVQFRFRIFSRRFRRKSRLLQWLVFFFVSSTRNVHFFVHLFNILLSRGKPGCYFEYIVSKFPWFGSKFGYNVFKVRMFEYNVFKVPT